MGQQIRLAVFALIACAGFAQNRPSSQGETALKTQFVEVQPDVKLEVLDWGGTGRNLVLLAGLGNTAHVFDSLGPKLAAHYHVIGITRRGFGQSSAPQTGYDPRRLGDDVVVVLEALHIADPVLVGHSIAGEELSAVSTYHPGRAAALIYLDAGAPFALYNPKHGDYTPALAQLKDDLSALQKNLFDDGLISKTLTDMALFQANLAELRGEVEGATPPSPKASDLASISAFQSYMKGYFGGIIPETEVRQDFRIGEDGRVGEWLGHGYPNQSVMRRTGFAQSRPETRRRSGQKLRRLSGQRQPSGFVDPFTSTFTLVSFDPTASGFAGLASLPVIPITNCRDAYHCRTTVNVL